MRVLDIVSILMHMGVIVFGKRNSCRNVYFYIYKPHVEWECIIVMNMKMVMMQSGCLGSLEAEEKVEEH